MERSEPTLAPQWLRSTGSVNGSGNASHSSASSLRSDFPSSARSTRFRYSRSKSDIDAPRSAFLNQISSSNFERSSSSSGSSKHPYSSFGRTRDNIRDKQKESNVSGDSWGPNCSDPLGGILISRAKKDSKSHSGSLKCRKPGEVLSQRTVDVKNCRNNNSNSRNGVFCGGSSVSSIQETAFEKDFPSLRIEEKEVLLDLRRVSSPGLSMAVQGFSAGNASLICGEGWTSALAEVPPITRSNSMGPSSTQQSVVETPPGVSGPTFLNMAEALLQVPSQAYATPQLPDKTQRLEALAIKQSKQLIPMTPSVPKGLLIGSDRSKSKAFRTNEMVAPAKCVQQQVQSFQLTNQSLCTEEVRSEASNSSHPGKFLILKPGWETGVCLMAKDVPGAANNASRIANNQLSPSSVTPTPFLAPDSSKHSTIECKVSALALNSESTMIKRPSLSQAQSRSDFFNLMRKKTSSSLSTTLTVSEVPPAEEKLDQSDRGPSVPVTPNANEVTSNGNAYEVDNKSCTNGPICPDEEEAAFLRSLGWEENSGEDDALTEEEINAFYEERRAALTFESFNAF
ncbi:uncharacterized protein LOC127808052 isoform X2 [Diospyros lotus]|uniref:uncharacterized protein LOC127808052 isoform X2 n=1 Tax=Diospyros lotus TaxID=55363 RepID=UPI002255C33D|nr:uncharacterized protein LOC127808052 isoform X2 [Diospyros lotus]